LERFGDRNIVRDWTVCATVCPDCAAGLACHNGSCLVGNLQFYIIAFLKQKWSAIEKKLIGPFPHRVTNWQNILSHDVFMVLK
jgi:hypothetical protein